LHSLVQRVVRASSASFLDMGTPCCFRSVATYLKQEACGLAMLLRSRIHKTMYSADTHVADLMV
jgi:hypothetical protein